MTLPLTLPAALTPAETRQQVRHVLLVTLILNLLVAGGKIAIGLATGALAITADGFHSLMDGSANLIALFANRIAARPPDEDHPYGHRRFETLAALGIGVLLLVTAWEIITSALERLSAPQPPEVTPLTFALLIGTLGVNVFVSRYERREGRRLRSELLLADAANTGADVFVTLSVLVSMVLVSLGVTWADPAAALIIVVLIGRAAWQVLRQTGGVLVDTAPIPAGQLAALAAAVPSVQRVLRARSRGTLDAAHIDLDLEIAPAMTADHAAAIAGEVRRAIMTQYRGVQEVEIHFEPAQAADRDDVALTARARADALGLSTHEVRLSADPAGEALELHVEVPPGLTLAAAHAQVTRLEDELRADLPGVARIITHIEPAARPLSAEAAASAAEGTALTAAALALLNRNYPDAGWHDAAAAPLPGTAGQYVLTLHAALPPTLSVEAAHRVAEQAETALRAALPALERVTIHTEPVES